MPKSRQTLSTQRRISWYAASAAWSLFLLWFVSQEGLFRDPNTAYFEFIVFMIVWATVVVLMRVMFRDMKDASNPADS